MSIDKDSEDIFNAIFKNNPTLEFKDGHIVTKLKCPSCGKEGKNTFGNIEFAILGKDKEGFMYLECPKCNCSLKYDTINGNIKWKKGLKGFFFGKYS